jgi:hypothetical protein
MSAENASSPAMGSLGQSQATKTKTSSTYEFGQFSVTVPAGTDAADDKYIHGISQTVNILMNNLVDTSDKYLQSHLDAYTQGAD